MYLKYKKELTFYSYQLRAKVLKAGWIDKSAA